MFNNTILYANAFALLIISILFSAFGWAAIGLSALIVAIVDFLCGIIALIIGYHKSGQTFLICSGVLLLIGFSVCTLSPIRI